MKKFFISLCLMLFCSQACFAGSYVNGYFKKDGTYVEPHYRNSSSSSYSSAKVYKPKSASGKKRKYKKRSKY